MSHESSLPPALEQLLSQITANQPAESTVRIQVGRTVAYKGTTQQAQINTLDDFLIADLAASLTLPAGSTSVLKSTVSITLDGECLYRSSPKDGVTVNYLDGIPGSPQIEVEALQPEQPEPVLSSESAPALSIETPEGGVTAAEAIISEPAAPPVPTLNASEILMMEMHDPEFDLPDQTMQWLYSQFQEVAQSQLVQSLQKEGMQVARNALSQVAKLPGATVEKGIADSIVALTKQFGGLQENADGSKQFKYEAENYSVTVRGTNHYTLSDKSGNTLFAFRHSATAIQATAPYKLSLSQRFEVMQAGAALTSFQVKDAARQGFAGLQTLASNLAQLAPKGTRERIVEIQQQQAVAVSEALVNTSQAFSTAAGKMFAGTQFKVFKTSKVLRVFATDGRGELLTKVGSTVKSRMNDLDLEHISKSAQTLASVFKSSQKQESRSSSGR